MFDWIKQKWERILLVVLTVLFILETVRVEDLKQGVNRSVRYLINAIDEREVTLDFSNKAGAARIRTDFTDLLVNSEGSEKQGEGYQVKLNIINPSSVVLNSSNIIYSWTHDNLSQAVTIANPNAILYPGSSVKESAFLSPMEGSDLKSVAVELGFEFARSH